MDHNGRGKSKPDDWIVSLILCSVWLRKPAVSRVFPCW